MKKLFALTLTLVLLMGTMAVAVFATDYTAFNLVFEEKEGAKVNETEIRIFASVDDGSLRDRTGDFTTEGVEWFKYLPAPENGKTADDYDYVDEELKIYGMLCSDEDVFEHDHFSYFLRIARLYAQEEDSFDRNVSINGVDIEEMNGLCFNTGNEFYIKTVTNGNGGSSDEGSTSTEPTAPTDAPSEPDGSSSAHKCRVCGICPVQPLGICLFIWIAVILILVVLIILLASKGKKKDKKDKKEQQ